MLKELIGFTLNTLHGVQCQGHLLPMVVPVIILARANTFHGPGYELIHLLYMPVYV